MDDNSLEIAAFFVGFEKKADSMNRYEQVLKKTQQAKTKKRVFAALLATGGAAGLASAALIAKRRNKAKATAAA